MNNYVGQRQQACKVLEFLQKELKLTDYICEEFKKGQVLYSVYLSDCMFAVYRNVKDNEMIYNVIRDVEKKYNAMVYHCVVSKDFINMLYVPAAEVNWEMPFLVNGTIGIYAAVYNMQYKFTEFGDIGLIKKANALTRVW